ncbi:SDR family NAD(P)-dependent oxidoreductase [Burkholderia lata]|uniref:Short-chain dehydrogenase/reductase SDR n=1 Tax=Burkholderia lata (strain ATCC 17760 / DSM 23089 / LMG 22485 / NCIMB 9086 / R18194 / 383) TaxID=482957 RepID=Q39GB0_BURL3|nr:SDR family oxidoreductase [Burkholderia lata]ABB08506.1 Short-chain dehydrogenase/reductase SDR [Burkholderia lata]
MSTHRKVAVVTGAAQGFGQAISVGLAGRGIDIVAVDLAESDATVAAVERAGARAVSLVADVSDPASVERLSALLKAEFGRCDILVNNAGIYPNVSFADVDYALWQRVHRVNLDSQFLMVKAVLPFMIERSWGRIVNITSNSVGLVATGLSHYMSSKAGVIGFTRGLATDVAEHGITVNAVGPTASLTTGGKTHIKREHIEALAQAQAIKRPGAAEDIVGTVLFLSSDDSAFVTGQTIIADGGLVRL